jgi:hypothetical protein
MNKKTTPKGGTTNTKVKKEHTLAITKRFLAIADELVKEGTCKTRVEFMSAVGAHQQNLTPMEQGTRYPTLENIALTCKKYGYNPTWVILGVGDKRLKIKEERTIEERVAELEVDMARLKRLSKK